MVAALLSRESLRLGSEEERTFHGMGHYAPPGTHARCMLDRPFVGWLRKMKTSRAGTVSRLLSDTNRRLFTLDFESLMLYYAHSEHSKQISSPIMVRNIVKVEALTYTDHVTAVPTAQFLDFEQDGMDHENIPAPVRSDSKGSLASISSRPSVLSLSGRRPKPEQFGFVIHYVQDPQLAPDSEAHVMELLCANKAEALQWIGAVSAAMRLQERRGMTENA